MSRGRSASAEAEPALPASAMTLAAAPTKPRSRRVVLGIIAVLAALGLWAAGAAAQLPSQGGAEARAQYNALFEQLLRNPTDVDLNFHYAEAAIKIGNYEAAISALERLLLYDPNYPGVKLQLAELYLRLNSYDMARVYLSQVERQPDVGRETLARVQELRSEIERAGSPSRITGNLLVGLRYQSNASAEPAGADFIAGGVPLTLSAIMIHKSGWDAFLASNTQYAYDLGYDTTLETNGLVYYSKQFRTSTIDSAAFEINSGPRIDVRGDNGTLFSVRPYILVDEVLLGNTQFLWNVGGGIAGSSQLTNRLGAAAFYEFRSEHFSDIGLVPTATELDAGVNSFGASFNYQVLADGILGFQGSYALSDARRSFNSYHQWVVRLSYSQKFDVPPEFARGPLIVTPVVYRIATDNDAANPAIIPTLKGTSREWRYGVTGALGLSNSLAATLHLIRETNSANLPGAGFKNTQVMLGLLLTY